MSKSRIDHILKKEDINRKNFQKLLAHPEYSFDIDEYSTAPDVLHAVDRGKTYDIYYSEYLRRKLC